MGHIFPKYILTCRDVKENKEGALSFINVFESISVDRFPTEVEDIKVVLGIQYSLGKKEERNIHLSIKGPKYQDISTNDLIIELRPTKKNVNAMTINIIELGKLEVEEAGEYSILVSYQNELLTRQDILIEREGE